MMQLQEARQKLNRFDELYGLSAPASPTTTAARQVPHGLSPRPAEPQASPPPPQLLRMAALLAAAREDVLCATRRAEAAEQQARAALAEAEVCRQRVRERERSTQSAAATPKSAASITASIHASEPLCSSVCDRMEASKENLSASANSTAPARLIGVAALHSDHLKELSALRASLHAAKLEAQARLTASEEAQRHRATAEAAVAECSARADAAEAKAAAYAAAAQQLEQRVAETRSELRVLQSSLSEAEHDRDEQAYRADEASRLHSRAFEQARRPRAQQSLAVPLHAVIESPLALPQRGHIAAACCFKCGSLRSWVLASAISSEILQQQQRRPHATTTVGSRPSAPARQRNVLSVWFSFPIEFPLRLDASVPVPSVLCLSVLCVVSRRTGNARRRSKSGCSASRQR